MKELSKAMAEAFPDIQGAVKDKTNPHLKTKYASLSNVIAAIKPALATRGLWFIQTIHDKQGCAAVETIIMHSSGESMSCGVTSVPVTKNDAQGYGSALTYARRYSLLAAFGVGTEDELDDDGEEACKQVRNFGTSEVALFKRRYPQDKKLETSELLNLASEIVAMFLPDASMDINEMQKYLEYWQENGNIFPALTNILMSKKERLLKSFNDWKSKQI